MIIPGGEMLRNLDAGIMQTPASCTVISFLMVIDDAVSLFMEYSPKWCYRNQDEWMKRVPKYMN